MTHGSFQTLLLQTPGTRPQLIVNKRVYPMFPVFFINIEHTQGVFTNQASPV